MPEPVTYEIELRGHVGARLLRPFIDDFTVSRSADGVTRLTGEINDGAHLHGLLAHVASMNLEIISIAAGSTKP